MFGLAPVRSGNVAVRTVGRPSGRTRTQQRIHQGVGLLSENRKEEGLALDQSIADNVTYSRLGPYSWLGFLDLPARRRAVLDLAEESGSALFGT